MTTLTEAEEALILQSQVTNLDRPGDRVVNAFHGWLNGICRDPGGKKEDPVLGSRDMYVLDDKEDLVAMRTPADKDLLSRFLQNNWPVRVTLLFQCLKPSRTLQS